MLPLLLFSAVLAASPGSCGPVGDIETFNGSPDFSAYSPGTLVSVPPDFELQTPDAINFGSSGRIADPKRYVLVARRLPEGGCAQDRGIGCTGTAMQPGASLSMDEVGHDGRRCLILYEVGLTKPASPAQRAWAISFSLAIPGLLLLTVVRAILTRQRWRQAGVHWTLVRSVLLIDVVAAAVFGLLFALPLSGGSQDHYYRFVVLALCLMPALLLALPLLILWRWPFVVAMMACMAALGAGILNSGMTLALVWMFAFGFAVLSSLVVLMVVVVRRQWTKPTAFRPAPSPSPRFHP